MRSLNPKKIFAANVRRLRQAAGVSQEALAARAGLHRTYISSIERGERNVALDNIFLIARALGVDARDLLDPDGKSGGR